MANNLQAIEAKLDKIIDLLTLVSIRLSINEEPPRSVTPDLPVFPTVTPEELPSACPKCGIKLDGVMGYVCNVNMCPTGFGATVS